MFDDRVLDKLAYILEDVQRKQPEFANNYFPQKSPDVIKSIPFSTFLHDFILAQMSAHTKWANIEKNINNGKLDEVFFHWDKEKIKTQSGEIFNADLKKIKCGAQPRIKQMLSLKENVFTLEKLDREYDSIGNYITTTPIKYVIASFTDSNGKYKMKWFGFDSCCEWLKYYIDIIKPSRHVKRILGPERLNFLTGKESDAEVVDKLLNYRSKYAFRQIDTMLWEYCREDGYSGICSKTPKCDLCRIKEFCNYKFKG